MNRREALSYLTSVLGSVAVGACGGGGGEGFTSQTGSQRCNLSGFPAQSANVDLSRFYQTAAQLQQLNMWCWAACISMIFGYRGHPVSQNRIVSTVYGGTVNFPALGVTIANALNRSWTDDQGLVFRSTVNGLYDAQFGIWSLTNDQIVATLRAGTPLVIGTATHARVLVEVNFQPTGFGANVVGATVFDPFTGQLQCLSLAELTPAHAGGQLIFLASVTVS